MIGGLEKIKIVEGPPQTRAVLKCWKFGHRAESAVNHITV